LPLALWRLARLSCCRTLWAAERPSPSARERGHLYQRHAADWDKERGRSLFEKPWLDRFLALLPPSASVLDIGCGAGEPTARYFIERGCHVTAILALDSFYLSPED
jgi:SAM-dependent methyltransferase